MPNLLDIRRRIRSVKNTQQITKALKMVSAAKLRRAQEHALAARPYAERLGALMRELAGYLDPQELADTKIAGTEYSLAELLRPRPVKTRRVLAISTDSGMVGGFNANVLKAALQAAGGDGAAVEYEAVGRKSRDFFRRRGQKLAGEYVGVFQRQPEYALAQRIGTAVMSAYASGAVDEVVLVGNEFVSVLQQRVATRRLLPFPTPASGDERGASASVAAQRGSGGGGAPGVPAAAAARDYIFESSPAELLGELLPRAIEIQIYRALLESFASEHAARMNAMEAATKNAGELIDSLTLGMNRVRQAAITKEIIEVVSGASALG